jgi:hypothetical protein
MDPEEIARLRPRGYGNLEKGFQGEGGDPSLRLVFGLEVVLPTVAMGNEPVRGRWGVIHRRGFIMEGDMHVSA